MVVRGLGGESEVDSDGEANRRESIQCCAEGEEEYKDGRGKRHTDAREMKTSARQKRE